MIKILIVEDEAPISNLISMSLEKAGYQCECVFDGMEAADRLEEEHYDLVLLDIMLPKVDGYELMEYIHPMGIPVIFLTAKSNVEDTVKGLEMGAEDYLTKPFEIVELLARVEVVLRRYDKNEQYLRVGDVEVNTRSRTVKKDKKLVQLTNKEYELLLMFIKNKNIALFRDVIYERIWEKDYTGEKEWKRKLRKKNNMHIQKTISQYKD